MRGPGATRPVFIFARVGPTQRALFYFRMRGPGAMRPVFIFARVDPGQRALFLFNSTRMGPGQRTLFVLARSHKVADGLFLVCRNVSAGITPKPELRAPRNRGQ